MEQGLPTRPEPDDLWTAVEHLAEAVGCFLMGTNPCDWPPELAAALDGYVRTVALLPQPAQGDAAVTCPLCEGRGRVAAPRRPRGHSADDAA